MEQREVEPIVEALLFAYGDKVELDKISKVINKDKPTTKLILENMMQNYKNSSRGIFIKQIGEGYQFCTKPEYYEFVKMLFEPRQKQELSQASFETLSIIAYNQPITKNKIENIRGVNSDRGVSKLLERNLIREAGRLDAPGRPLLYETTEEFLKSFGFKSCSDLPEIHINEIQENPDLEATISDQESINEQEIEQEILYNQDFEEANRQIDISIS